MNKEIRNAANFRANMILMTVGVATLLVIRRYYKKAK